MFVGGGSAGAVVSGRGASLGSYCSAWSSVSTISSWQRRGDTCPRWVLVKKVSLFHVGRGGGDDGGELYRQL